jgi:hypothetical protein
MIKTKARMSKRNRKSLLTAPMVRETMRVKVRKEKTQKAESRVYGTGLRTM